MSDLNLLTILENIDKLDAASSNEFLRSLCKQAAKEIKELDALRLRREKQWQGLTEQERLTIENECETMVGKPAFDAIEAKLKEKNK